MQLNGPFNLFQTDSIAFRYADGTGGCTAGSPLAAIDLRQDSITGPVIATANLVSTGGTGTWATTTVPLSNGGGARAVPDVPHGHGRPATGAQPVQPQLGSSSTATASRSSRRAPTVDAGGTVPATLALTLGTPAAFGPFTPGVAKTYTAIDDGERHLDGR